MDKRKAGVNSTAIQNPAILRVTEIYGFARLFDMLVMRLTGYKPSVNCRRVQR